MPVAAAGIGAVASIGSSLIGSHAAHSAADAQAAAANHAADLTQQRYEQTRGDLAPWRTGGATAFGQLSDMLKPGYDYTKSPGYDFRFNEGQRAIDSSAAAKGMSMSGGTLKDLLRYGQGFAANDFNDSFNRAATVSGQGLNAAAMTGTAGSAAANAQGNFLTDAGKAQAGGIAGSAGAINTGLGSLATLFQQPGLFGNNSSIYSNAGSLTPSVANTFAQNPSIF